MTIYLSVPVCDLFGAGTCGKYLLREFAARTEVCYDPQPDEEALLAESTRNLINGYRRPLTGDVEMPLLQFGGPAGTLSTLGEKGAAVAAALSAELVLPLAPVTWHSARDGFARLGAETAILAGSSSMAHKRNPALSMLALEAAQRTPGLAAMLLAELSPEHERGLGQWQSQWFTLRELFTAAASALAAMAEVLQGLEVDVDAMRANLERLRAKLGADAPPESDAGAAAMIERALAMWREKAP